MNQDDKDTISLYEKTMANLIMEKAPASLSARLHRIPDEESGKQRPRNTGRSWFRSGAVPRWVLAPAMAAVPLLVVFMLMQPKQPSEAEIEQARQDLAIAFAYLDKVGYRTGSEIQSVLGSELRHIVKEPLSKHMPFTEQSLKEEST